MAEPNQAMANGGGSEDTFEQDLKDILEDGPDLNDMSNTVQSGSPQKIISTSAYGGSTAGSMGNFGSSQPRLTRSFTMPPGVLTSFSFIPLINYTNLIL